MKRSFLLFGLLLFISLATVAQDTSRVVKKDSLIRVQAVSGYRSSGMLFTFQNQVLTNRTMKPLLMSYAPSAIELRKSGRQSRTGGGLLVISLAGIITGGVEADQKKNETGSAFQKAPIPFSIGLGGLLSALIVGGSNHHFIKAVNAYNSRF